MSEGYRFESLPVSPVRPGTTLLVTGRSRLAARLAQRLALDGHGAGDGTILVSTNTVGSTLAAECASSIPDFEGDRLGIVDVTGRDESESRRDTPEDVAGARIERLSSASDLTGISIKVSVLYSAMAEDGIERVRTCFDSISLLLLYSNPKTMTRFVNSIRGRISAADGLGAFVLDPSMHDPRVVYTLQHLCDGRIEVQSGDDDPQFRVEGLSGQPTDWTGVDL